MTGLTTLGDLLPSAADRDPDGSAISVQGESTTWREAHLRAGRFAAALEDAGVGRGDRVGVHFRKSADSFLAMHAVVGRGAIAVPLDPTASDHYLGSVMEQTGATVVISHDPCRATAEQLAATGLVSTLIGLTPPSVDSPTDRAANGATVRCRQIDAATVETMEPIEQPASISPDDSAYIITTSGSTGRPKGICHTHASALAYVRFKLAAYDYRPDDRISDIAPNHFDISTQALWVTPFVGATNVVIPEQFQIFPASLSQLMADERLTVWYGVPYQLAQMVSRGTLDERDLSALRWVLFGGEVLPPQVLAQLMALIPSARFSNVYGPAEVNACAIHHLPAPPQGEEPVAIGQPVSDTEIRLVDPDSGPSTDNGQSTDSIRTVADGEQGEIWVRGSTMMVGYWGQPDLSAASIVQWDGGRWYRTGDVGFEREDGNLVFSGRVDHQVKVRGYRVELESIESVLEDLDGVAHAIATVARSEDGSDQIIAGVVAEDGVELDPAEMTTWAREHLPLYAVPGSFYAVGSMPVTGSGKLDRRAIRTGILNIHFGGKGIHHV